MCLCEAHYLVKKEANLCFSVNSASSFFQNQKICLISLKACTPPSLIWLDEVSEVRIDTWNIVWRSHAVVTDGWEPAESFKTVTKGCLQFCIQVFHYDILQSTVDVYPSACCATVQSHIRRISADV